MATAGKYKFTSKKYKRLMDFSGGLNNKFSPFLIKDNEVSDIQNMNFDEKGTLRTRRGFKRHYAAPFATGPIRGLFNFRKSDGTSKLIMAADDKLFYDNPHFVKLYDTQADYDSEQKSNVDTSSSAGDVKIATPAAPTFTRNSVAYNDDGTQVAVNVPRFRTGKFGQGILIEEGTTNLLTANQSSADGALDGGCVANGTGTTVTRDITTSKIGSACIKVVCSSDAYAGVKIANGSPSTLFPVTPGQTYSVSIFIKGAIAGIPIWAIAINDAVGWLGYASLVTSTDWVRYLFTFTVPTGITSMYINIIKGEGTAGNSYTWYVDGIQLEQKSFSTSFMIGGSARNNDDLSISTNYINTSEGDISLYAYEDRSDKTAVLFQTGTAISFYKNSLAYGYGVYINSTVLTVSGNIPIPSAGWHLYTLRWSKTNIDFFIDGQKVFSKTLASEISLAGASQLCVGANGSGAYWNNAIDDLRISSRARTDAEILAAYQSNLPLPWDVDTTYKLNFDGNLNFPSDRGGRWTTRSIDITQVTDKSSGIITKQITQPTNSTVKIKTRTSADQSNWSAWAEIGANGFIQSPSNNYLQVQLEMTTTDFATVVPKLSQMQITFDSTPQAKQLIAGLSSVARVQCATQNDIVFAVNGENPNKKWDGITASALDQGGSPPVCKYILVHKNRMFLAGNPTNPSRIYFSTIGSPEDWPVLNFIDVGRGDGDVITGLSVVLDNVIIYKENSRWVLQGDAPSNFVLRKSGDDGASSPSTIIVKDSLACLAKDGVRFFDGLRSVVGSEKIEGTINNLNKRYLDKSSLAYFENKLMVAVPEGNVNYNNLILVFDSLRTAWTLYRGISASEFCIWKRYDEDVLLFGSAITGQVYEFDEDSFSDDGAAIDAWAVPAHMPLDGIEVMKLIKGIIIGGSSQNGSVDAVLNVSFIKDQGTETASQPLTLTKGGKLTMGKLIPAVVGVSLARTLAIKLRHTSATTGADIYSITTEYTPKGVRV